MWKQRSKITNTIVAHWYLAFASNVQLLLATTPENAPNPVRFAVYRWLFPPHRSSGTLLYIDVISSQRDVGRPGFARRGVRYAQGNLRRLPAAEITCDTRLQLLRIQ